MGWIWKRARFLILNVCRFTDSLDAALRVVLFAVSTRPLAIMVADVLCAQWQVQATNLEVL